MSANQSAQPKQLGPYEIHDLLGMGSMGAVYRAYQPALKRYVAIKILPPRLALESDYLKRFNREAETAAQLEHPGIVPIHDYGIENGTGYIVMRLLTGGTLADRLNELINIKETIPTLAETANLLRQLASSLDYAHSKGVIHRDLKPGNVIFDEQGNAFLADFGIAKLLNKAQMTGTGLAMGTPAYMAPEQWLDREIFPATDQYALGVIIYSMVTGYLPFEAGTAYGLMSKHINDLPVLPHVVRCGTPASVSAVIERALSKDPSERYLTVTAFAESFEEAIANTTAAAQEPTGFFITIPKPLPEGAELAVALLDEQMGLSLTGNPEAVIPQTQILPSTNRKHRKRLLALAAIPALFLACPATTAMFAPSLGFFDRNANSPDIRNMGLMVDNVDSSFTNGFDATATATLSPSSTNTTAAKPTKVRIIVRTVPPSQVPTQVPPQQQPQQPQPQQPAPTLPPPLPTTRPPRPTRVPPPTKAPPPTKIPRPTK